ncbi:MAG: histidinol-phosphate transaminase [Actinobacteria bacterium]|nr:histidinol-phosphate transaminase [Actinomycetota bacterium]
MVGDSVRFRDDLHLLPGYQAGKRPQPDGASGEVYSLASNEIPYGPLPGVLDAMTNRAAHSHRYPDPASVELVAALAARHDVSVDQIALGTGSVAICQQVVAAACHVGDEVVFAWRSFEAYPIVTRLVGAVPVQVPNAPDHSHDLAAMRRAITERTKVVFLCTPNNPTGPLIPQAELVGFLNDVPSNVLVVVDEAYHEFAVASGPAPDGVALTGEHSNVLALRTFSKAYGLAGLRVGYGVASEQIVAALRRTALPFGVNSVAAAAGVASLKQQAEMERRVAEVVAERERVLAVARERVEVPQSAANFYWLPLGERAAEFAERCEEVGVTVRAFPGEGVRVSVGEPIANERVLRVLADFG